MRLADYYLGDDRLVLVPIEHLTRRGMTAAFATLLLERSGWSAERVALLDEGFTLYWERARVLAHSRTWPPPRIRNIAVVREPDAVRPYTQLLNTSTWTLYDCDLDPTLSHRELVAYLLVHGDCMAETREVTMAAVRDAAYWFERTAEERAAFAAAAARSPRPDGEGFRALGQATEWLRRLRHETLRPPVGASPHRAIPGTGLLVPRDLDAEPPRLVEHWTRVAARALERYHARWRTPDKGALDALCSWLSTTAPPVLIVDRGRILWDPEQPSALGRARGALKQATGAAVRAVAADLAVIDRHTRRVLAAVADPAALPAPPPDTEQRGYAYLHTGRRLIAYDLREPGMERLAGPDLPYARAMLGARVVHEWAHLAAMAGWVPRTVDAAEYALRVAAFATQMESVIAAAPRRLREAAASDLAALAGSAPPGEALASLLLTRVSDYQANVVAWPFLDERERETYVRHNIRTLRPFYQPQQRWRMLVRYLYEYQYLGLSAIEDPRTFFFRSTWFDADFVNAGVLDEERFDALAAAVRALCACHAVDTARMAPPGE